MIYIMQFINFANFYKRFIRNFFKIVAFFIEMFKNNSNFRKSNRKQKKTFKNNVIFFSKKINETFEILKKTFIIVFVFRYFDLIKFSKIKIDVFDKIIEIIFSQQNENDY